MDTLKKFVLMLVWIGLLVGIVVLMLTANADIQNWIWSAMISIFVAVCGALLLRSIMNIMCLYIDPNNKVLRTIINWFCGIIGTAAAIYLTILIRPFIAFF